MQRIETDPDHVIFGSGAEKAVATTLETLNAERVLLIAMQRHEQGAQRVARSLGERCVGVFLTDRPQVPGEVADAAVQRARQANADWVVAHGGGTTVGIAKAIALELDVKIGAIPTTYAGSERTDIWGITRDGVKTTGRDDRVRPRFVAYDPDLTRDLPVELSMHSLFNALAHSLEALYDLEDPALADSPGARAARDSLGPLVRGIRAIHLDPTDPDGRSEALYGAYLASTALREGRVALHHKLAHVLGGSYGTPHAPTHSILLPYTFAFNAAAAPRALQAVREAWTTPDPPAFLYDLQREVGLKTSLRTLDLSEEHVEGIVEQALRKQYPNPRPVDAASLSQLLADALHDRRPSLFTCREPTPEAATPPHAQVPMTVRGAPLSEARKVLLAVHGRGASADRFAGDLERRLGLGLGNRSSTLARYGIAIVAPQAFQNTWYPTGFRKPVEDNQPHIGSALAMLDAIWAQLAATIEASGRNPSDVVVPVGFSQGACLLTTWVTRTPARPARILAFTGAHTPLPDADHAALDGLSVHLCKSAEDPWIPAEVFDETATLFESHGADVDLHLVPGSVHTIHPPDDRALRAAVDLPEEALVPTDALEYQSGFGNALQTEALPGALPRHQNSPRNTRYRLVAEQLNGTGFTVHRNENRRVWMYRLRPQILDVPFRPYSGPTTGRFVGTFDEGVPSPEVMRFKPVAIPSEPTDFIAGLTTFAGAGGPTFRKGAAVHLYAANADMDKTAFCNIDGDLLVAPQEGRLHVRTELGRLSVAPGEIVILPRGIRFAIALPDGVGRGYVAELFDGHFTLPERGPVGANGLADERHFKAPVADFEDDPSPHTIIVRQGGKLWEIDSPHSPFDVVAWHGTYAPFKYDLADFNSLGSVSFDHPDPSILTVLTSPMDTRGRNAIDVAVFRGRWDVAEHTFRPPYFHRNSAIEFNAVLSSPGESKVWKPGTFTYTPYLTPHGISAHSYENTVTKDAAEAEQPERIPDDSLWIQFESTYLMTVMPWMFDHPDRDDAYLSGFSDYGPAAELP